MEKKKPGSSRPRASNNGGLDEDDGQHEEKQRLRLLRGGGGGLEDQAAVGQQEARPPGMFRRKSVRAALVLCLLTLPAGVLLLQWWRAANSPLLFDVDLPKMDDDYDQGMDGIISMAFVSFPNRRLEEPVGSDGRVWSIICKADSSLLPSLLVVFYYLDFWSSSA